MLILLILMHPKHKEILARYFPARTLEQVTGLIINHSIHIKFTSGRNTKLGDYRPPGPKLSIHRITVNGNLNPWFLYLVFLHEFAHLLVWNTYKNRVNPHGEQWKQKFSGLLKQVVENDLLPDKLKQPVLDFSNNVKATFASNPVLWKILKSYDEKMSSEITIEDIPFNAYFKATNGKLFKKEEKLRTRYRCLCIDNKRRYLFHPMASIRPVEAEYIKE